MLEFAGLENNALTIVQRLDELDSKQSTFVNFFTSCLPQLSNKFAVEDAKTIEMVANGLDASFNNLLFTFASTSIYPPVQNEQELNQFKAKILIGIYLKVWSNYKSTLFYFLNRKIIELMQNDLGINSPMDLDPQLIETSLTALSHFSAFLLKHPDHEVYAGIDSRLGMDIQAQVHTIRSNLLQDKAKAGSAKSWTWFDNYLEHSNKRNVELFKEAMDNDSFFSTINASTQNQAEFIKVMEGNKFSSNDVLELINEVNNAQVKSLLIINLLCKHEYYQNLPGDSFLTHVNNSLEYRPARLHALLYHLDVSVLTIELIAKLDAEAALSILCSVPHFHQLHEFQVKALLKRNQKMSMIRYWLHNYAMMPNAHYVLAHLMQNIRKQLLQEFAQVDGEQLRALGLLIINNWHLFKPDPELFALFIDEEYLNLAIKLVLNGHENETLHAYINYLIPLLIKNNHQFSLESIHLIMALPKKIEFKEIHAHAPFMHHYLLHYRGCPQELIQTLNHFFDSSKKLHNISSALENDALNAEVKESVFSALLHYSDLYDDATKHALFVFNPQALLQHFGFKGGQEGYEQVIALCTWASANLKPSEHATTLELVNKAQIEAEQELAFMHEHGMFAHIMQFFKRCMFYGWTGFIQPNEPLFVVPAYFAVMNDKAAFEKHPLSWRSINLQKLELHMHHLIAKIKQDYTLTDLDQLQLLVHYYSLKANKHNELDLRGQIDALMNQLAQKLDSNPALFAWYIRNEKIIKENQHRLAELVLENNELEETKSLLTQCALPFACMRQLLSDLSCYSLDAYSVKPNATEDLSTEEGAHKNDIFNTISNYANSLYTIFSTSKSGRRNSISEPIMQHGQVMN